MARRPRKGSPPSPGSSPSGDRPGDDGFLRELRETVQAVTQSVAQFGTAVGGAGAQIAGGALGAARTPGIGAGGVALGAASSALDALPGLLGALGTTLGGAPGGVAGLLAGKGLAAAGGRIVDPTQRVIAGAQSEVLSILGPAAAAGGKIPEALTEEVVARAIRRGMNVEEFRASLTRIATSLDRVANVAGQVSKLGVQ